MNTSLPFRICGGRSLFKTGRRDAGQIAVKAKLLHAIAILGADRVMFAVDCPLDDHAQACARFDTAEITERDRSKIGRDSTMTLTLFGLG